METKCIFFFFCRMSESTRAGRAHFPCSVLDSETEGAEACIVGLKVRGPTSCPHMWLHGEAHKQTRFTQVCMLRFLFKLVLGTHFSPLRSKVINNNHGEFPGIELHALTV